MHGPPRRGEFVLRGDLVGFAIFAVDLHLVSSDRSGIPHIILPVWLDTYDYAARAEFLNIGIFGSKRAAPDVQAEEFGDALVRATGDSEEAAKFRTSAKRLKDLCRSRGNGREISAATIMKVAGMRN